MNKFYFLIRCDHAEGEIVDTHVTHTRGIYGGPSFYPVVKFSTENYEVTFTGDVDSNYEIRDKVDVVYLKSEITNAKVFNLNGFWLRGFIYGLFPFFILSAFVYSFMDSLDEVKINFDALFSSKKFFEKF